MTFERKYRDLPSDPPVELTPIGEKCFHGGDVLQCKVYKRRWLILLIFVLLCIVSTSQWTQYAIINNIVVRYYHVEIIYVEWTAIVFMAVYIPAIIPALMFLEKKVCTNFYLQIISWSIIISFNKPVNLSCTDLWCFEFQILYPVIISLFLAKSCKCQDSIWYSGLLIMDCEELLRPTNFKPENHCLLAVQSCLFYYGGRSMDV
jgi:hypothetical protein